jgi:hypothetical protein
MTSNININIRVEPTDMKLAVTNSHSNRRRDGYYEN